jgi:predicted Rossmann fold nucleotide-binding protein DprA/Smf involved in DNA uptake
MSRPLSPNTQAILLLTAPLLVGRGSSSAAVLTHGEYKRLVQFLRERRLQPSDLLASDGWRLVEDQAQWLDSERLRSLLDRGFLLSQALERWQSRSLWVLSRADAEYPRRWKARLREDAPPVLYGCGEVSILETGGLAVVGSRHVDEVLITYTESIGRLTASTSHTLVSGAARGIDQAAMRGALEAGGQAVGVLADSLERAAVSRENRQFLMNGRLVLVSSFDPAAGFNVGHAMQRNKLVYALADAALVVNAEYEKGGTWAGAVEQLEKWKLIPVYVRSKGETGKGLDALLRKGALPWPHLETPETLAGLLTPGPYPMRAAAEQQQLFPALVAEPRPEDESHEPTSSFVLR